MSSVTGSLADTLGTINPIRYRSYYYDNETVFYYLNSRYYNPEVKRFINEDGLIDTRGLITQNLYSYAGNNPIMFIDSNGQCITAYLKGYTGACPGINSPDCYDNYSPADLPYAGDVNSQSNESLLDKLKNDDGTYSLYDNRRHDPDSIFHEQSFVFDFSEPSFDLSNGDVGLGSVEGTLITGGWEFEHLDLSLLDFGHVETGLEFSDGGLYAGALASFWSPSITVNFGNVKIGISAEVGAVGGQLNLSNGKFSAKAAGGIGAGLIIEWE